MDKFKNNDNEKLEVARIIFVQEIKKLAENVSIRDLKVFRMAVEILACLMDKNREMNKDYLLPELGEENTKKLVLLCGALEKAIIDFAEEENVSKLDVYKKFIDFLKMNFKSYFPSKDKSNIKSSIKSPEWSIKNNLKHFIYNTKYSLWEGNLAKYIILEEQPEFNIGNGQQTFSMRGFAIISVENDDYLFLGMSQNGKLKFDCLKIIGTQLSPVADNKEYAELQDCINELRMHTGNR